MFFKLSFTKTIFSDFLGECGCRIFYKIMNMKNGSHNPSSKEDPTLSGLGKLLMVTALWEPRGTSPAKYLGSFESNFKVSRGLPLV